MTPERVTTKSDLLDEIERAWSSLQQTLAAAPEAQMAAARDADGWTVADHVLHLARWVETIVAALDGQRRERGLGLGRPVEIRGAFDAINAEIRRQHGAVTPGRALERLATSHRRLLGRLASLDDAALGARYGDRVPDAPAAEADRLLIDLVYANSAHHFDEHRRWIEALVTGG